MFCKPPKYICLWAAIFVKLTRYRISILLPTAKMCFLGNTDEAPKWL
jgi:hypothetical protein